MLEAPRDCIVHLVAPRMSVCINVALVSDCWHLLALIMFASPDLTPPYRTLIEQFADRSMSRALSKRLAPRSKRSGSLVGGSPKAADAPPSDSEEPTNTAGTTAAEDRRKSLNHAESVPTRSRGTTEDKRNEFKHAASTPGAGGRASSSDAATAKGAGRTGLQIVDEDSDDSDGWDDDQGANGGTDGESGRKVERDFLGETLKHANRNNEDDNDGEPTPSPVPHINTLPSLAHLSRDSSMRNNMVDTIRSAMSKIRRDIDAEEDEDSDEFSDDDEEEDDWLKNVVT